MPCGVSSYSSGAATVDVEILLVVELLGAQDVDVEAAVVGIISGRVVSLDIVLVVNEGFISQGFVMGE